MNAIPRRSRALLSGMMAGLSGALLLVIVPAIAAAQKPPQEWDGLVRVKSKALEYVYVRPNVEFKAYKKVRLDAAHVAMDKNWDPNEGKIGLRGGLSSADVERMRGELAKLFRDVFAERLAKAGYPLVETGGDDVLLVQPAIIDVYVNAPDSASSTSRSYVLNAGRMTLVMQLADSVTGQLLARVVDKKEASTTRGIQIANSVSNSAEARAAIGQWADALCKGLDALNGKGAAK